MMTALFGAAVLFGSGFGAGYLLRHTYSLVRRKMVRRVRAGRPTEFLTDEPPAAEPRKEERKRA
jgi:hypothetical protein